MWFVVASHTFFYVEHFWNLILWFAVVIYLPKILNQQSSLSSSTAVDISHLRRRKKQQIEHPTGTHNWIRTSLFLLLLLLLSLKIRWDWKIFRISFFVTRIFWVFVYFSISFGKNFVEHTPLNNGTLNWATTAAHQMTMMMMMRIQSLFRTIHKKT